MKMLVGMNYNDDGTRSIARITLKVNRSEGATQQLAECFSNECDEAYMVDFDVNDTELINFIVTEGCRL